MSIDQTTYKMPQPERWIRHHPLLASGSALFAILITALVLAGGAKAGIPDISCKTNVTVPSSGLKASVYLFDLQQASCPAPFRLDRYDTITSIGVGRCQFDNGRSTLFETAVVKATSPAAGRATCAMIARWLLSSRNYALGWRRAF